MEELDGDEAVVLLAASLFALSFGQRWYSFLWQASRFSRNRSQRVVLGLCLPGCLALVLAVLRRWSDPGVATRGLFLVLFIAIAAVWLLAALHIFPLLGLNPWDDAAQVNNPAGTAAVCGALLGVTLCYAGANRRQLRWHRGEPLDGSRVVC